MKKKVRFGELNINASFEWAGKELIKNNDRRARELGNRTEYIFSRNDIVSVFEEEEEEEINVYGCIPVYSSQDLADAYGLDDDWTP